jgi:hypothetical protein
VTHGKFLERDWGRLRGFDANRRRENDGTKPMMYSLAIYKARPRWWMRLTGKERWRILHMSDDYATIADARAAFYGPRGWLLSRLFGRYKAEIWECIGTDATKVWEWYVTL